MSLVRCQLASFNSRAARRDARCTKITCGGECTATDGPYNPAADDSHITRPRADNCDFGYKEPCMSRRICYNYQKEHPRTETSIPPTRENAPLHAPCCKLISCLDNQAVVETPILLLSLSRSFLRLIYSLNGDNIQSTPHRSPHSTPILSRSPSVSPTPSPSSNKSAHRATPDSPTPPPASSPQS